MENMDLFGREQRTYDKAIERYNEMKSGVSYSAEDFGDIVKEYGRLLKQLRRVTKISDRTTVNLNTSKLDLLDKVHYDSLTGIYNRRYMEENLMKAIKTLSRSGGTLSVLMSDIDYFKKFNDTYGHSKGDECLKLVASTLNDSVTRANDFVARYGGEEFIVVLPDTNKEGAHVIAKRILEGVKACNIPHEKSEVASRVTISIGITTGHVKHTQNAIDYIKCADEALYISKNNGRNRFTFRSFEGSAAESNEEETK